MRRTILMSICGGAVALSVGCGRHDASQGDKKNILDLATHPAPAGSIAPVEVVGCLSASGNRFVLSHIDQEDSKTVAYQLLNADDQLTSLVGREVRVTGEAQPAQKADARGHAAAAGSHIGQIRNGRQSDHGRRNKSRYAEARRRLCRADG